MKTKPVKVLIIDKDEGDYILTSELFSKVKVGEYELDWAASYEEGLKIISRGEHHVCLLGHRLGEKTGVELIREARASGITTPMIVLTGFGDREMDVESMMAGATDYLVKDETSPSLLERTIRYAVQLNNERKCADEALRSSELRYRRLFQSAKDGILILDADSGQIIDVNAFLIQMLGFSKEEFVGKELWQIGLFKDIAASKVAFTELQERGYIRYENLPLETRGGSVRLVEFVSNSYLAGASRVIQCNIRDITERKHLEQTMHDSLHEKNVELENASLAKTRFLASMSHELRTPLNAIIGFTGTLLMKLPGPLTPDQEKQLRIVQNGGKHLLTLINDLLDLARVESGKVEVKYEPIICQGVVEEVAAALRPLAESKGLDFKVKVPKGNVLVESDRRILSQILLNLASNAIKFTDKGAVQIELSTRPVNGHSVATIEVVDTGVGIRPEDKEKLFQAFQQVDINHRAEGSGLGLYLSQKLAVQIEARIELESEHGTGSVFRLLIPRDEERIRHTWTKNRNDQ